MFTEALFLISKIWNQSRYPTTRIWISKCGVSGKESACNAGDEMQETWVQSLGLEDSLEEATCSIILTWKIPWIEEPDRLQSIVLQRVGHDWVHTHTYTYMNMMHPCNWILFRNFKNNEQKKVMNYQTTKEMWKNFKCVLLSERRQSEKATWF